MAIDLTKYGTPVDKVPKQSLDFSKYGTPVSVAEPTPEQDGFFKSVYKSLASPVFNLIARPGQAVQALTGNEVSTGNFLGVDINNPQNGKDVLKDVGRGLETVALGVGGGGTANVIKQGFKEGIKTGIKEGAIVGLQSSPLFGAGASLEQGNTDIRTILKDAAIATAVGVPTSAVLGGITPAIVGGAKKFTQQGLRDELGSIYRETASKYTKAQTVLDQSTQVHKTDPVAVLQMYGKHTIPEMAGGGADVTEAQAFLNKKIGELSNLKKEALFLSDEKVPLAGYKKYTDELVDAQSWSNVKKAKIKKDLDKIFADFNEAYKANPDLELIELDKLKTEQTGKSKSYNNPNSPFDYDSHAIAGKGARDLIELLTDNQEVKDLNKLIQGHYDAIDLMEALKGKKIHGGALSKMFFKLGGDIVGATAGSAVGNPVVGAVAGHVISGKIADIVQNKFITNPVKRLLINQLKEQSPKEVNAVLKSLEGKYKTIFDDLFPEGIPKTLKQTPVKPAPKVNEATEINLGNQSLENNQSIPSPITKPITTASKIAIPKTVAKDANKSTQGKNYKIITEEGVKDVQGKSVKINDELDTFIHKGDNPKRTIKGFVVSEKSSGKFIATGDTEREAISNAKSKIEEVGIDKIKQLITQKPVNKANTNAETSKTSKRIISESVPQKKGIVQRIVDKYKSLPNKQGGFAKVPFVRDDKGKFAKVFTKPESAKNILKREAKDLYYITEKFNGSALNSKGQINLDDIGTIEAFREAVKKGKVKESMIRDVREIVYRLRRDK